MFMETFILRNEPYFEISVSEEFFEINNSEYQFNNGKYFFNEIQSIEFNKSKTDWLPTIIGNVISFLFNSGDFGKDLTSDRFIILFDSGKQKEVKFMNCDLDEVQRLYEFIQFKI